MKSGNLSFAVSHKMWLFTTKVHMERTAGQLLFTLHGRLHCLHSCLPLLSLLRINQRPFWNKVYTPATLAFSPPTLSRGHEMLRDGPLEKCWGGGWGIFSWYDFFFRAACAGIFFPGETPCTNFFLDKYCFFF